jgi:PST family polysaccharide transporter/antigen flippase
MNGIKSAFLVSLSQISKIILGLFTIKVISIYLGPEGLGKLGHFMSFVTFLFVFSGGGIQNAIIKYTAEFKTNIFKLRNFINISIRYSVTSTIVISTILIVYSKEISLFIFKNDEFYLFIILFAMIQFFMSFNKIVRGVANGYKETKIFVTSEVIGVLLSLPLIWFLVSQYNIYGAAMSLGVVYSLTSIPYIYFFRKSFFWNLQKLKKVASFKSYSNLYKFSLMTLISAIIWPFVEILIRQMVIDLHGYNYAGIWQASLKLSHVYIGFFSVFLASYFVPTISEENSISIIRKKIVQYSCFIGAIFIIFGLLFYQLKDFFITLLFSNDFLILSEVIFYQLIGDFFKILSFVIAFVLMSKAFIKVYILMEILQGGMLIIVTKFNLSNDGGFELFYQSYLISNILFYLAIIVVMFKYIKGEKIVNYS